MAQQPENSRHGLYTLAFIGCGNLGSAILSGVLDAIANGPSDSSDLPPISHIIATVRRPESAERLRDKFQTHSSLLSVLQENLPGFRDADVVILGCKPYMAEDVLGAEGVRDALAGKLLISILAGMTALDLEGMVYGQRIGDASESEDRCRFVRVLPSLAAQYGESMTSIAECIPSLPQHFQGFAEKIFRQIGQVKVLPPRLMDVAGHLGGASSAMLTVALDGLLDGCVAEGMQRSDALEMAAQCLRGLAATLSAGVHPAVLREQTSSPGGSTIQSLLTLETGSVRSTFANALVNGVAKNKAIGRARKQG